MDMPRQPIQARDHLRQHAPYGVWLVERRSRDRRSARQRRIPISWSSTPSTRRSIRRRSPKSSAPIAGTPASAIVRPAWNDMVLIKRAARHRARRSLLIPFVQNAEEAKRAVAFTRYPPDGVRGVAAVHRGSRYGNVPTMRRPPQPSSASSCRSRRRRRFEQLPAIAAVPGIDSSSSGRPTSRRRWATSAISTTRPCRRS